MKNVLASMFLSAASLSAFASGEGKVIASKCTSVGFAPEDIRGVYCTSVLENGVIVSTKRNGTPVPDRVLATLSPSMVQNLRGKFLGFEVQELKTTKGPMCSDAPSVETLVANSAGVLVKASGRMMCRDMFRADAAERDVARGLETFFQGIQYLDTRMIQPPRN